MPADESDNYFLGGTLSLDYLDNFEEALKDLITGNFEEALKDLITGNSDSYRDLARALSRQKPIPIDEDAEISTGTEAISIARELSYIHGSERVLIEFVTVLAEMEDIASIVQIVRANLRSKRHGRLHGIEPQYAVFDEARTIYDETRIRPSKKPQPQRGRHPLDPSAYNPRKPYRSVK